MVRGSDPIPAYRLSGGTVVPSVGALPKPREPTGIRAVIRTAEKAGLRLERIAERTLHLVV